MKKFAVLGAVLAALVVAAPAQAADAPIRGPIYKAAPAPVYNWTGFYVGAHVGYGWASSGLGDLDGFLGGVQAGYNWQFNRNWVFGIEGDISATDMNLGVVEVDYLASIRARLGYAVNNVLFYGTAGAAFTRVSALGASLSESGWAAGAGIEWAFAHRWTAKVEYLYYDIDAFETSALKFGVNYRF